MGKRIFFWSLRKLCRLIDRCIEDDFDFNVVITGNRGLGKSTLAYEICKGVKFAKFKPRRDLLYSKEDVVEALSTRKQGIIVGDEIIQTAFNRDFYSQYNKLLIKTLTMYRDSNNLFISCIPNFASLDNQFRSLIRMRIDVVQRGMAVIHTPTQTQYSKDYWDTAVNEKIEKKWLLAGTENPKYSKLTTFRGALRFPDLSIAQKKIYDQIKAEKRNQIYEDQQAVEKGDMPLSKKYDFIEMRLLKGGYRNLEDLKKDCELMEIPLANAQSTINKRLKNKGLLSFSTYYEENNHLPVITTH